MLGAHAHVELKDAFAAQVEARIMHVELLYDLAAQVGARDLHEGCMREYGTKEV